MAGRVDLSLLVTSKALSKRADEYKGGGKMAHVELARRMAERDPASAPGML